MGPVDEDRMLGEVEVRRRGAVTAAELEQAREKVTRLAHLSPRPVLGARVELHRQANPALQRPAEAKARLDVSGRVVRAHVAASQMPEAIDLLEARLRAGLHGLVERDRFRTRWSGLPESGEWRHGDLSSARPAVHPRPADERVVSRRKQFVPLPMNPEDAAAEMEMRDYEFFLFGNALTGRESLVARREDGSLEVAHVGDATPEASAPFAPAPAPAPAMDEQEAVEAMNLGDAPCLFYEDRSTGRGTVLYRRYDGHYGSLTVLVSAEA